MKMCLCHGDIHAGNILISENEFYQQITDPGTDEEERALCLKYFNEQFDQNNVIDMALRI